LQDDGPGPPDQGITGHVEEAKMNRFNVRKVAVLGAGVMGAQIAAHLVNVRVPVVLFDLPSAAGAAPAKSAIALKAIDNLKKIKPAPLGLASEAARIQAANYEDDLGLLAECDLIIEAIAERMDWKRDLYAKVAPHIAPQACRSPSCRRRCPMRCAAASAASTSSTRRATWPWWS
jgi:3-hydroxyacyl-CoA dehydrogenase